MKATKCLRVIIVLTCLCLTSQVKAQDLELKYEFLFEADLNIGKQQVVGKTLEGKRATVPIIGKTFSGPQLKGKILSGADWLLKYDSGTTKLDIRILMETDDGALIYWKSKGFTRKNEGDDDTYYLRTVLFFETGSKKYQWLNDIVSVGVGKYKMGGGVQFRIYQIK
ncbi:DUF3237 domain-containing protein [Flavivirga jejuensis]|uniref:UPF0311 protein Q4Q40_22430 n=1 Tax=Flavivirga jejuensis TaxID=870487 RepID=A0ABT8WUV0_9FLAO|nr:DUF3237 domain-containing protein [Flavivirga jejuensis]MDO5976966.1 DUF3237 domain-containing protein [Flavivirga jejuensis]